MRKVTSLVIIEPVMLENFLFAKVLFKEIHFIGEKTCLATLQALMRSLIIELPKNTSKHAYKRL